MYAYPERNTMGTTLRYLPKNARSNKCAPHSKTMPTRERLAGLSFEARSLDRTFSGTSLTSDCVDVGWFVFESADNPNRSLGDSGLC
jgi:hypothetical protein